jgi:5'-3' exoribonuclease 2
LVEQPAKICEVCILGKQHRNIFPSGKSWRERDSLQLIHSDMCGHMQIPSLGKIQYFITFIDDFSRKTWVYFLNYKSEAFEIFKQFKALPKK